METLDEDLLAQTESGETFSDYELFSKIFTQPVRVLSYVKRVDYTKYLFPLLFLAALSSTISSRSAGYFGTSSFGVTFFVGLAVTLLFTVFLYYLFAATTRWVGLWFGAKAKVSTVFLLLTYGSVTSILSLVFLLPVIFVNAFFNSQISLNMGLSFSNPLLSLSSIVQVVLLIWGIVLKTVAVSVALNVNRWLAFFIIIIALLLLLSPLFLLVSLIFL